MAAGFHLKNTYTQIQNKYTKRHVKTRHTVQSRPWLSGHVLSVRIESELSKESITNLEDLMEVTHTLDFERPQSATYLASN